MIRTVFPFGVTARLLRLVMVFALVMLGVAMPQGAARHEMLGMPAMTKMALGHDMVGHGAEGMPSDTVQGGHSLACAIACAGVDFPTFGLIAPMTFQAVSTGLTVKRGAFMRGLAPAPAAQPPRYI